MQKHNKSVMKGTSALSSWCWAVPAVSTALTARLSSLLRFWLVL